MIMIRPATICAECFDEITESGHAIVTINEAERLNQIGNNVKKLVSDLKDENNEIRNLLADGAFSADELIEVLEGL